MPVKMLYSFTPFLPILFPTNSSDPNFCTDNNTIVALATESAQHLITQPQLSSHPTPQGSRQDDGLSEWVCGLRVCLNASMINL